MGSCPNRPITVALVADYDVVVMGVATTQAVLWGVEHGFIPDHHRIEHWRGGP